MKFGLKDEVFRQIVGVILEYKKPEKVVIFGSRSSGSFKDRSDIDIAIFGKDWTDKDINIVKYNLDESVRTLLKFDVLNFYNITKAKLRENILEKGKVIYDAG